MITPIDTGDALLIALTLSLAAAHLCLAGLIWRLK